MLGTEVKTRATRGTEAKTSELFFYLFSLRSCLLFCLILLMMMVLEILLTDHLVKKSICQNLTKAFFHLQQFISNSIVSFSLRVLSIFGFFSSKFFVIFPNKMDKKAFRVCTNHHVYGVHAFLNWSLPFTPNREQLHYLNL